jgi:hypothetical protein
MPNLLFQDLKVLFLISQLQSQIKVPIKLAELLTPLGSKLEFLPHPYHHLRAGQRELYQEIIWGGGWRLPEWAH